MACCKHYHIQYSKSAEQGSLKLCLSGNEASLCQCHLQHALCCLPLQAGDLSRSKATGFDQPATAEAGKGLIKETCIVNNLRVIVCSFVIEMCTPSSICGLLLNTISHSERIQGHNQVQKGCTVWPVATCWVSGLHNVSMPIR